MTLSFRNRILLVTNFFSISIFFVLIGATILGLINGQFLASKNAIRVISVGNHNVMAVVTTIIFIVFYVIVVGLVVYRLFRKIQSSEIIYFNLFLFACLFESLRFFPLYFNAPLPDIQLLLIISRIVFFGRFCVCISFLISAIFLERKQEDSIEKNFLVFFAIGIICAFFMPFDTNALVTNGMLKYAVMHQVMAIKIFIGVLAFICYILNSVMNEVREMRWGSVGFLFLYIAYLFLSITDNFILFFIASFFLSGGTAVFLKSLHQYYLWK